MLSDNFKLDRRNLLKATTTAIDGPAVIKASAAALQSKKTINFDDTKEKASSMSNQ